MVKKLVILSCLFAFILPGCCNIAFCQDSLSGVVATPSVVLGEPTQQSLSAFRKTLLEQARAIASDKSLSVRDRLEARGNVLRLTILTSNKAGLEKAHQICAEHALGDGQAQSYAAIDWSKLASFIKEMIPIILELIKLFAYVPNHSSLMFCEYSNSQNVFYLAA